MQLADRLPKPIGLWGRFSRALTLIEIGAGACLVALILALMMANIIARGLGAPLIWTDELAVAAMVWLAFIGASVAIATKTHMVMGLLPESLSQRWATLVSLVNNLLVLLFLGAMAVIIWDWLDLPGLIKAGSGLMLAQTSFNFIYTDPTLTLGLRKIWFWLILPISTLCGIFHCIACVVEDLRALRDVV